MKGYDLEILKSKPKYIWMIISCSWKKIHETENKVSKLKKKMKKVVSKMRVKKIKFVKKKFSKKNKFNEKKKCRKKKVFR